ncbi:hypothetical protein P9112_000987 [Eukaryota sp. TZLM1-RC]
MSCTEHHDLIAALLFELVRFVSYATVVPDYADSILHEENVFASLPISSPCELSCRCLKCNNESRIDSGDTQSPELLELVGSNPCINRCTPFSRSRSIINPHYAFNPLPPISVQDLTPCLAERISEISQLSLRTMQSESSKLKKGNDKVKLKKSKKSKTS